jgi:hypothetical protein
MVTHRLLEKSDHETLAKSLAADEYHKTTSLEFFTDPDAVCILYLDDGEPVLYARGQALGIGDKKVIRLDLQYCNNNDVRKNLRTMMLGFPPLADSARENGFDAIVFQSDVSILRDFCMRRLGFQKTESTWMIRMCNEDI